MTFLTHPDDATLQRLHEGGLTEAEERATREHVSHCDACKAKSARVSMLFAVLATPPELPQPAADFLSRVMARVEEEGLLSARSRFLRGLPGPLAAPAPAMRLRSILATVGTGAGVAIAGGVLAATGGNPGAGVADLVTSLTNVVSHAGVASTVLSAAMPVIVGGTIATLAAVTPFFLKAFQNLQPRPVAVRVPAR